MEKKKGNKMFAIKYTDCNIEFDNDKKQINGSLIGAENGNSFYTKGKINYKKAKISLFNQNGLTYSKIIEILDNLNMKVHAYCDCN